MRMWIVIYQFEIFILEVEDALHIRVYLHLRQRTWFAGKLQFDLLQMIQINVRITECMNEIPCFQSVTCAIICNSRA